MNPEWISWIDNNLPEKFQTEWIQHRKTFCDRGIENERLQAMFKTFANMLEEVKVI